MISSLPFENCKARPPCQAAPQGKAVSSAKKGSGRPKRKVLSSITSPARSPCQAARARRRPEAPPPRQGCCLPRAKSHKVFAHSQCEAKERQGQGLRKGSGRPRKGSGRGQEKSSGRPRKDSGWVPEKVSGRPRKGSGKAPISTSAVPHGGMFGDVFVQQTWDSNHDHGPVDWLAHTLSPSPVGNAYSKLRRGRQQNRQHQALAKLTPMQPASAACSTIAYN